MPDESMVLQAILSAVDHCDRPVISHDYYAETWPQGAAERCAWAGILRPDEPARYLPCRECSEQPIEEVLYVTDGVTGRPCPYLPCYVCGPVEVPPRRLRRWSVDNTGLLDTLFAGVELAGERSEIVPGRLWRLGRARWNESGWSVYFGRGLHRRDAWDVLSQARLSRKSVVFTGSRAPAVAPREKAAPLVVPLRAAVSWDGTAAHLDHGYVERCLAGANTETVDERPKRPRKRGARTANIEVLVRELEAHLRSARDHAYDTRDRTGVPRLLPRPTMDELARKTGIHKSTVSRCMRDEEGRRLQFLWHLAVDLDRILAYGSSRR